MATERATPSTSMRRTCPMWSDMVTAATGMVPVFVRLHLVQCSCCFLGAQLLHTLCLEPMTIPCVGHAPMATKRPAASTSMRHTCAMGTDMIAAASGMVPIVIILGFSFHQVEL